MRKVIGFRDGAGGNSAQSRYTAIRRHASDVQRAIQGKLEHADSDGVSGKAKKGNLSEEQVTVKFLQADQDTFVGHDLGHACENWTVVRKSGPGEIYDGKKPARKRGLWLRCSVAGVTATIRVDGSKQET
jgi:hypothetical protein